MARSGSTNFSVTRDNLIQDALEDLGILPIGGTLTTAQKTKAALKLNLMVKRDMARGIAKTDDAKITGITPPMLIFNGRLVSWPRNV